MGKWIKQWAPASIKNPIEERDKKKYIICKVSSFFFEPEKDSVFFHRNAPQGTNEHVERLTNRTKTPFFLWEVNPKINRFSQDNKKKSLFSLSSPPFESEITCLYLPSCHGKTLIWRIKTVRHFALLQKAYKKSLPLWKIPTNFVLLWSRHTTLCLNL